VILKSTATRGENPFRKGTGAEDASSRAQQA
jgi:hypothetical protein